LQFAETPLDLALKGRGFQLRRKCDEINFGSSR